MYSLTLPDPGV